MIWLALSDNDADTTALEKRLWDVADPYDLALEFGLERMFLELNSRGQAGKITHIIVEKRGEKEDNQLELAFRRICAGANALNQRLPFELVMIPKASNSTGLQMADLVARSVGIKLLRPMQPNRAYDIVAKMFRRSPAGETKGWGLKVFPSNAKGLRHCQRPSADRKFPVRLANNMIERTQSVNCA